ncbi:MAG: DUF4111 domain-containing protein [Coprobacillaceae bacterium]
MDYTTLLKIVSKQYEEILQQNLIGIYVHGSIAFGCFNWNTSDIDFIVVVKRPLRQEVKLRLLEVLEKLLVVAPRKGFEMSVVLEKHCHDFIYPTPYELHFSKQMIGKYFENPLLLCNDIYRTDFDLAAHFTIIKNNGIIIYGEEINKVFGMIPKNNYVHSICLDIENAEEEVLNNPSYIILNLCRVYAYIMENLILSKEQGGYWGLKNLPIQYHTLIEEVINNYTKDTIININDNQGIAFCKYMLDRIYNEIHKLGL